MTEQGMPEESATTVLRDTQLASEVIRAWSEYPAPTVRQPAEWRRLVGAAKYGLPALAVALVLAFFLGGQHTTRGAPTPAVPVAELPALNPAPPPSRALDDRYLRLLVDAGFSIDDRAGAIAGGHWVCTYLGDGHSAQEITRRWDARPPTAGLTAAEVHAVNQGYVDAAIKVYCPQYG